MSNILIDCGGCLFKDEIIYKFIVSQSRKNINIDGDKDNSIEYNGPSSWDEIRSCGTNNFFDQYQNSFFQSQSYNDGAIWVINSLCEKNKIFIVYDNNPKLKMSHHSASCLLAKKINDLSIKAHGIYIDSDKIKLATILGADIIIDDDPRIILASAANGVRSILMLRKWNRLFDINHIGMYVSARKQNIIEKNIEIVEDWSGIESIIGENKYRS